MAPFLAAIIAGLVLAGSGLAPAQEEDFHEIEPPEDLALPAEDYSFRMILDPGIVVNIALREATKKQPQAQQDEESAPPDPAAVRIVSIQRDIRTDIIGVRTEYSDKRPASEMFYAGGWCAYDDPRQGLNVRRPHIEGLIFPMQSYHFPELMWAAPSTRQPDPVVGEGEPALHLYEEGGMILEVDAATLLPLRFFDGQSEWTYSFAPPSGPLVVPENIREALLRVLPPREGERQ